MLRSVTGIAKTRHLSRFVRPFLLNGFDHYSTGQAVLGAGAPPPLEVINLRQYIKQITPELKPPVANKLIFSGEIKVMVVGGPNSRSDYHVEMGEELFYQLKGRMELEIVMNNRRRCIPIEEGQMFLLPAGIPHSPQRFADSIGLVFERERYEGELDAMRWYLPTERYDDPLRVQHEEFFHCTDLGTQIKEAIENYQQMLTGGGTDSPKSDTSLHSPEDISALNNLTDKFPVQPPFAYGIEAARAFTLAEAGVSVHKILDSEFSVFMIAHRDQKQLSTSCSGNSSGSSSSNIRTRAAIAENYGTSGTIGVSSSNISRTELNLIALGAKEIFLWQESGQSRILRVINSQTSGSSTHTEVALLSAGESCIIPATAGFEGSDEAEAIVIEQQGPDDRLMTVWNRPGRTLPPRLSQ